VSGCAPQALFKGHTKITKEAKLKAASPESERLGALRFLGALGVILKTIRRRHAGRLTRPCNGCLPASRPSP
jgi:hypothetical protein